MSARTVILTLISAASPILGARAQVTVIQSIGGQAIEIIEMGREDPPPPMDEPMVQGDAPKPAATAPGPRLDKLKKLEFDRRPSAILAAWSKGNAPDEPAPDEAAATTSAPLAPAVKPAQAPPSSEPEVPLDEAALAKKKEAEAASKKKADEAKKKSDEAAKKAADAKALEAELKLFQRHVTLGDWKSVDAYLASLTEAEKKPAYERLLANLQQGPQNRPSVPQAGQPYVEKNRFSPADVLALAEAAPLALAKENLEKLGQILRQALDSGHQMEDFLAAARPALDSQDAALDRRRLARVLVAANEPWHMGEFLPSPEKAEADGDREALNLIARHRMACFDKDQKTTWLVDAWKATQAVLAEGDVKAEAKTEALTRAVDIAPKLQKELGQAWLDESFAKRPERGMEILSAIGSSTSLALSAQPSDGEKRFKLLQLQTTAADTLLAVAPERAAEWRDSLEVLATNWLKEALVTYQLDDSTSLGPRMQRDTYGNVFYYENNVRFGGNNGAKAIRADKVLSIRPSDAWLSHLQPTLRPRFDMVLAQLYLKVAEDRTAFPYIEALAASHPRQARELGAEFLRVWTKNHDPNADKNLTNRYMFMYGFDERANSIPVTRSKQDRNLAELREWNERLTKVGVVLEPDQLANAFMGVHSQAEVYKIETIEGIFGSLAGLDTKMLAALLEKMRLNLATVWRDPAVQDEKKTKRREKDIEAEVIAGYERGFATIESALAKHADDWRLLLAQASFAHDANEYKASIEKDSEYSSRRGAAFASFARAAQAYATVLPSLAVEDETTTVYEMWFYAALGACDLKAVDHKKVLAAGEIAKVRAALVSVPVDRAERHMAAFVNSLVTRVGSVSPSVKFRYVREGLAIVGEHERAREIREIYTYYRDLTSEIQLEARLEAGERVGHERPFGLRVDLRHTKEIERESGGFSKYLQNQNSQNFSYNYGRPLEDYRDKFETALRETLSEHFEVASVTFNDPAVRSKPEAEDGWRRTPYAYVLLKAKGPEVDRIPALRLDLDFLDTSGYAVVPVESAALVIDARADSDDARPVTLLTLTQTLDERQAKDEKLVLEVKATAHGLVPTFDAIATFAPSGFDVARENDHGPSIVKFDEDGVSMLTERSWTIQLRAKDGLAERPSRFEFATARLPVATNEHFRYADADLATVGAVVDLEARYGTPRRVWPWVLLGVIVVASLAYFGLRSRPRTVAVETARFRVPEMVTPFTVLGLLREIKTENGLAPADHEAIAREIDSLESHYFGEARAPEPDLKAVAQRWVTVTSARG
ncbi:MAG: hypothetical protein SGI72_12620 [Planctomycetota bacterium]|nr:hypothetical protein [Planctomycetota bacterium]